MDLLIASVREHKSLYDPCDKDYMRTKFKDQLWDGIAKYLHYSNGQEVKDTWRKLRDCHRDALRRQSRKKSGSVGAKMKMWVYQKQMEFLLPYMTNRTLNENSESYLQGDSENSTNSIQDCVLLDDSNNTSLIGEHIDREDGLMAELEEKTENNVSFTIDSSYERIKKQKIYDTLRQTSELVSTREVQGKNVCDHNQDSLYQFFYCMYDDTKRLSKISQLRIKRKLFEAVQFEEELRISEEYQIPSTVECLSDNDQKC